MSARYEVVVPNSVRKALNKLPAHRVRQVSGKIDALAVDPRPPGSVKLAGYDHLYRIRAGDYRIVYEIDDRGRIVIILIVAHRRDVYRGL